MPRTQLFDRSDRARIEVSGASAAATINGLVTNDVAALRNGSGLYAAALTAKGKLVADMIILAREGHFIIGTSALAAPALRAMFAKYVNPRFARHRDMTAETLEAAVVGDDAAATLARLMELPHDLVEALTPYHHLDGSFAEAPVTLFRLPGVGVAALRTYGVIAPRAVQDRLIAALHAAGVADGSADEWNALRVESGTPEWGADMDETTLPQEANFDELHGVSYTKGCYIGQETVARIHFRGHVNRTLRRVSFSGPTEPPRGAALLDAEHRAIGDVRSTARSTGGDVIGIAMIRREIEDGARISARWDGGAADATVTGKAKGAID